MRCDPEKVHALAQDALAPQERAAIEDHLSACAFCREEKRRFREREGMIEGLLAALDPQPGQVPPAAAAYERFRAAARGRARENRERVPQGQAWRSRDLAGPEGLAYTSQVPIRMRIRMYATSLVFRRRFALVAALVAFCLATVIGFAPARQLVSKFLGIFRVRQFSAVTVDREHLERLQSLGENLRAGMPAEPEYERTAGEPQKVSDAAEASRLAGFAVKAPAALPASAEVIDFSVAQGPIMRYTFDREKIAGQLEAAGLGGVTLPPMESGTIRVEVPAMAHLSYRVPESPGRDTTVVEVIQVANPSVTLPPGADVQAWGEWALQLLGVPEAEASRLARSIDWTSTLVVPLPAEMASFREVEIHGANGLLVEQRSGRGRARQAAAVLWQSDDVVYCVRGEHILPSGLLEVAESLR